MRWLALALLVGCYRPTAPAGAPCSESGDCPADQVCIANLCSEAEVTDASADALDGPASQPDAPPPIAPRLGTVVVSKGGGGSRIVALPADVSPNDLLLAHVSVDNHTAAEVATPSGWTRLTELDADGFAAIVFYAFYSPLGPSTTWTFPADTPNYNSVAISVISKVDRMQPIDAFGSLASPATALPEAPSILTTITNTRLMALFTLDGTDGPIEPPLGMIELYDDVVVGTGLPFEGASAVATEPGATGPRSASVPAAGLSIGILVALAPERP